jgi:hypothetical protein
MTTGTIPTYVLANMSISALKTSFIVSLIFFIGMVTSLHAQATKPAPPTPIDEKKVALGGRPWNPQWAGPTGCPAILPAIL